MRAPVEQQRQLLEIQKVDTAMAKLLHQRRSVPELAELEALAIQQAATGTQLAEHAPVLKEARQELNSTETKAEQIQAKIDRNQGRLDAGTGSPKDLQALQAEIVQLKAQLSEVEDAQLEAMDALETAENTLSSLLQTEAEQAAGQAQLQECRDAKWAKFDAELQELQVAKQAAQASVSAELLAEYERIRARTGGVGAVTFQGNRVVETGIEFSVAELEAIKIAHPEDVVCADDYDYILVRID